LLHENYLVKTVRFSKPRYIGDPINAVKLFNDLEVDELMLLDIGATQAGREPNYQKVKEIVSEAFMPVAYGGGVKTLRHVELLLKAGVEKVVITTAATSRIEILSEVANAIGSQSVVAGMDIRRSWLGSSTVTAERARRSLATPPVALAAAYVQAGAGELLINSVDRDGCMRGYDLAILRQITAAVSVPVVACGGAGSLEDVSKAIDAGASAAAAGSLFVYKGPHRGVLINYPSSVELATITGNT
jgi:cyclase